MPAPFRRWRGTAWIPNWSALRSEFPQGDRHPRQGPRDPCRLDDRLSGAHSAQMGIEALRVRIRLQIELRGSQRGGSVQRVLEEQPADPLPYPLREHPEVFQGAARPVDERVEA